MNTPASKKDTQQSAYLPKVMPDGSIITYEQAASKLRKSYDNLLTSARELAIKRNFDPDYWFLIDDLADTQLSINHVKIQLRAVAQDFEPVVVSSAKNKNEKRCSTCFKVKPLDDFYRNKRRLYGRNNRCKDCDKSKELKLSRYVLRKKQWERIHDSKEFKARTLVRNLIAAGKLVRQPCVVCGEIVVDAHHLNYDFPDKVIWLCRKHHSEVHHGIK